MRRKFIIVILVVLAILMPFACRPHPVGATRSDDQFQRKATTTASTALSAVQTVALAIKTDGDTLAPYLSVLISDQEDSLSGVTGTFDSIQPPTAKSDALRAQLNELLNRSLKDVTAARLSIRRGDGATFRAAAQPLQKDADELNAFIKAHKS